MRVVFFIEDFSNWKIYRKLQTKFFSTSKLYCCWVWRLQGIAIISVKDWYSRDWLQVNIAVQFTAGLYISHTIYLYMYIASFIVHGKIWSSYFCCSNIDAPDISRKSNASIQPCTLCTDSSCPQAVGNEKSCHTGHQQVEDATRFSFCALVAPAVLLQGFRCIWSTASRTLTAFAETFRNLRSEM